MKTNLNIIVRKLSELVVVHAEELGLLGCAQLEAGDGIDGVADQAGDNEGVGGGGEDVGDLDTELLPVLVDPAAGHAVVDSVKPDDVVGAEQPVEDETDHARDTVLSEHIHGIVDVDQVLDLGSVIADDAGDDPEEDGGVGGEETGSGGGSNKPRDETGAETDHGPFAGKTEIEDAPSDSGHDGGEVGVPACHERAEVRAEGGTAVESEPAKPEEDGAESDEGDVVRAEVEEHLLLALSEDEGVGQCADSGTNLDRSAAGIVHHSPLHSPAVDAPDPHGERAVDEGCPDEGKDHGRKKAAALGNGAHDNSNRYAGEHHLVEAVEEFGNERGAG